MKGQGRNLISLFHFCVFLVIVALIAAFDNREGAWYIKWAFIPFFTFSILNIKNYKRSTTQIWFLLFTVWCAFSLMCTIAIDLSIERLGTVVLLYVLLLCGSEINYSKEKNVFYTMLAFTIGTIYLIYVIRNELVTASVLSMIRDAERISGEVQNTNVVGKASGFIILFLLYEGIYKKKKLYFLALPIFIVVLLITKSKSSLISTIFACLFLLLLSAETKKQYYKPAFYISFFIIVFYYIISQGWLGDAFTRLIHMFDFFSTGDFSVDVSTAERAEFAISGLETFTKEPITGFGIGSSYKLLNGTYYHNNYVQLLVETGIIGFIFYYAFMFSIFKGLYRRKSNDISKLLISLLIIIIVCDFTNTTYYHKINFVFYAMAVSFINNTKSDNKKINKLSINNQ